MIFEKLQMIMKIITQLFFTRLSTLQRTLNMIAVGLTKQQALAIDPKAVKQTNFTWNLDQPGIITIFLTEESKETILGFFTRNCEINMHLHCFNEISL